MLINCPNCNASYEVTPDIIPQNGRKLRCSNCGEVFWCNPHDAENPVRKIEEAQNEPAKESVGTDAQDKSEPYFEEPATGSDISPESQENHVQESDDEERIADDVDMQDIFQRLTLESDEINKQEQNMKPIQKLINKFYIMSGWHKKTNRIAFYSTLGAIVLLLLIFFRVEVARKVPFVNVFYSAIGMDAIIPGEGLEFRNVTRREYVEDDIPHMEIRGFIDNPTSREIYADFLHLEVLDNNGNVVQEQNEAMPVPYLVPRARVPFSMTVIKPSALGKYIVVTFAKAED